MKSVSCKFFLVAAAMLLTNSALASEWILKSYTDSMTDAIRKEVYISNGDGDRFTLIRKSDGAVWGYVKLSGGKQFNIGERLMVRIDKNKPMEFNGDLDKIMGGQINTWEWNPSLVGFQLWAGESGGCETLKQIYSGSQITVRYHPNDSTSRDVLFVVDGGYEEISSALDIQPDMKFSQCEQDASWRRGLIEKMLQAWERPSKMAGNESFMMNVKVDGDGNLVNLKWIKPTGNRSIDRSIINAFKKSAPYDPPHNSSAINNGIIISYPKDAQ